MFLFLAPLPLMASLPCAQCHKAIATAQAKTAMANTWIARAEEFSAVAPDDSSYRLNPNLYSVGNLSLPVDFTVGGRRHGVGFLCRISQVGGNRLARPVLIQARYAWSPEKQKLVLAPGCSSAKPQTLEAALGLALSPTFEARCLGCHGRETSGIICENCHGPSTEHPKRKLTNDESIAVCAQCHVGLTRFADPSGDDLLVANQVAAIQRSECYLQSGKAFSCTNCHDPHRDATDDKQAVRACLTCHSLNVTKHAAICPVNAAGGCVGCHMPAVEMGALHLVDHLIRVHPEQKVKATNHEATLRSQVEPVVSYLRMIAANSREAADRALAHVRAGESFYNVARESSVDATASIGGYLGLRKGMRLDYGETSGVMQQGDKRWVIFQRLPRDFKWDAEQLEVQAEAADSINLAQEALKIYPHYLRALNFIGVTFAQKGNPKKGCDVLTLAAKLYPQDAATEFALASALEAAGDKTGAGKAFEETIILEKDFTAAYVELGMLQYTAGDLRKAIETFRNGLQIDPLSWELNKGLAQALRQNGDLFGANQAAELAGNLRR